MANLGFFGGLAEGIDQGLQRNQQNNIATQELQLKQEALRNQQQREIYANADKATSQAMDFIGTVIDHGYAAGHTPEEVAKLVQPLKVQVLGLRKRLGDADMYDAMITARLAQPSALDVANGRSGAPNPSTAQSSGPSMGTPAAPRSKNLTDTMPEGSITGIDVENLPPGAALPVQKHPVAKAEGNEVDRLTRALALTDNPGLRTALTARLQAALRDQGDSIDVKTIKDADSGAEHVVFIDKKNKKVTDERGNPYIAPSGDGDTDNKRIADAIVSGRQPPTTTGLYRNAKGVKAELERRGFDLSQAGLEWQSAQTQVKQLNSQRMIQYTSLAKSVDRTIDEALTLSKELENSGVPLLNKAKLATIAQTQGNTEQGQLVARYLTTINTLKEEFANLANGGYAPTESAWALANQQINGDYGVKQLGASLGEVQRLIRYRLQAIPNLNTLGPGGTNRYTGQGGKSEPSQTGTVGPVEWELVK